MVFTAEPIPSASFMPSKNCCTGTALPPWSFGFLEEVRLLPSRLLLVCPPQAGPRSQPTNYPCPDLCTLHWEIIITLHVAKYSSTLHLPPVDMVFSIGLCTSICLSASKKGHLPLPLLVFRMLTWTFLKHFEMVSGFRRRCWRKELQDNYGVEVPCVYRINEPIGCILKEWRTGVGRFPDF